MKLFSRREVEETFQKHVIKDDGYFKKWHKLKDMLTPAEKAFWVGKDVPRLFSLLEFREWIVKHNLAQGKKLFLTDPNDCEVPYLSYAEVLVFPYDGTRHDLHTIDPGVHDFDMVVFNQTLEHLYNPFVAVENLCRLLRPGGALYTTVPTLNIPHLIPHHFWGITPIGLCMLCKSAGFEILECGYWGNFSYLMQLYQHGRWADYNEVGHPIDSSVLCQAQTWILARKPL